MELTAPPSKVRIHEQPESDMEQQRQRMGIQPVNSVAGRRQRQIVLRLRPYAGSNGITPVSADVSNNPKVNLSCKPKEYGRPGSIDPTDGSNNTMDKN